MPKLTEITLRNLPIPLIGQVTYDDEGSPLRVRVSQGGAKTFVVSLGRGRRYTIGRFGEVSLLDAREAARRLRAEKTLGRILPATKNLGEARTEYLAALDIRDNTRLSDLLISDRCEWSGVIAKLFAESMRPTRKAG